MKLFKGGNYKRKYGIQGEKNDWLHSKTMAFYLVSSLVPIQVNIRHLSDCFKYTLIQTNKIVNTAISISFFGQKKICVYQKLQDDFAWTNFTCTAYLKI